jgi:hypothetical protein
MEPPRGSIVVNASSKHSRHFDEAKPKNLPLAQGDSLLHAGSESVFGHVDQHAVGIGHLELSEAALGE